MLKLTVEYVAFYLTDVDLSVVHVKVCMLWCQAAHDSGKLADSTVFTVGCSKEEFDRHHRIRPLEKDMEIMLTKVNLPSQSADISTRELIIKLFAAGHCHKPLSSCFCEPPFSTDCPVCTP